MNKIGIETDNHTNVQSHVFIIAYKDLGAGNQRHEAIIHKIVATRCINTYSLPQQEHPERS